MVEKYSVLMSLYIREKPDYLQQSIDSMLNQTVKPDEIVIVKDGPITEELELVIRDYSENHPDLFNIVTSEINLGLGRALNLGLKNCRNELVARMDTDDISLPERCEKQLLAFEADSELVIVGTMVDEFNDDPAKVISSRVVPTTHNEIYAFGRRRSPFNHPSVMYKRSSVLECGGYGASKRNEDGELFGYMLFRNCKASNLNESLVLFRANEALSKRRKSWENATSYISTIKMFWRLGYSSFADYAIVSAAQIFIFISPIKLQNWIYKRFLRKQGVS